MRCIMVLAGAVCLLLAMASALPNQPRNPVIGIVTLPSESGSCVTAHHVTGRRAPESVSATSCFWSIYSKWIEGSGIRVVPFLWDDTWSNQLALMGKLNGLLFTGGGLSGSTLAAYFQTVQKVYQYAMEQNAKGDPFVLWGTCEGFQLLSAAAANDIGVIVGGYVGMDPAIVPVNFTANQPTSRMFGAAPTSVLWELAREKTTVNWHSCGVLPSTFESNQQLRGNTRVLSTNVDVRGKPFVSSFEGTTAAVYATQWHPERVYEFSIPINGTKTQAAFHTSQYLSMFLRDQLQKNNHTFGTPEETEKHLLANYQPVNQGYGVEIYYFRK
jgi:gamma-glutamyl hydrolase